MKLVPEMMILNIQWIVISLLESSWSLCRINENRICTIEARIDSLIDKLWVKKYIIDHLIQKSSEISLVSVFWYSKIVLPDIHFNCEVKVYV